MSFAVEWSGEVLMGLGVKISLQSSVGFGCKDKSVKYCWVWV